MKTTNTHRKTLMLLTLLVTLFTTTSASAVEALSTGELALHCNLYYDESASEDRTFCIRYIQGFIDGAVATDASVTNNVAKEYDQDESYAERATRTRIGARMKRYGPSVYAEYCFGDPVPLKEVVEHVVEDIADSSVTDQYPLARDVVYLSLRTHYPCKIED